ncbi:unnamed protein product, partial [Heterotrigona itama]
WYVGDMSRQRAESLLKQEDKEGCFVVRNSSTKGLYTLSLYTKATKSPSLERSPSILPSSNSSSSYNSATLPSSRKTRAPASLPPSVDFLHLSSSTCKLKKEGSSSPSTPGHQPSQPSSSSSNVCDICSSYGHPWIEICKAIRATKGK